MLKRLLRKLIPLALAASAAGLAAPAVAQNAYPQNSYPQNAYPSGPSAQPSTYSSNELVSTGHRFFGEVSGGLASVIEKAVATYGLPNGYILGEEGGAALVGGLRYGEGALHTRDQGQRKVYWQGPSVGWDFGGQGARTMMLVYNLPAVDAIYQRFGGVEGSLYFVGGFSMTALTADRIVVVPVRAGVGVRLGANIGYLKMTPYSTWNPF